MIHFLSACSAARQLSRRRAWTGWRSASSPSPSSSASSPSSPPSPYAASTASEKELFIQFRLDDSSWVELNNVKSIKLWHWVVAQQYCVSSKYEASLKSEQYKWHFGQPYLDYIFTGFCKKSQVTREQCSSLFFLGVIILPCCYDNTFLWRSCVRKWMPWILC